MLGEYYNALIFLLIVGGTSGLVVILSLVLTRKCFRRYINPAEEHYESGFPPLSTTEQRFEFKYLTAVLLSFYLLALIGFVFLFAVAFNTISWSAFFTVCFLMFLAGVAILYAFRKRFLE